MNCQEGLSVIIPAHNESKVIPRLLAALTADGLPPDVEILVVANGCTDETVSIAKAYDGVRVAEIEIPSKQAALAEGNRLASFPNRAFVDADVVIDQANLAKVFEALNAGGVHAAAPRRNLVRSGVQLWVKWYYDVWERLPQVQSGLFGRGVIVVSAEGHRRLTSLPRLLSDDLMYSEAFAASERVIVGDAVVTVWIPRTFGDLLRRRVRVATGNTEMDQLGLRNNESRTSMRSLARLSVASPGLLPKVGVFISMTVIARVKSRRMVRRGDFTTWLRDESSRTSPDWREDR